MKTYLELDSEFEDVKCTRCGFKGHEFYSCMGSEDLVNVYQAHLQELNSHPSYDSIHAPKMKSYWEFEKRNKDVKCTKCGFWGHEFNDCIKALSEFPEELRYLQCTICGYLGHEPNECMKDQGNSNEADLQKENPNPLHDNIHDSYPPPSSSNEEGMEILERGASYYEQNITEIKDPLGICYDEIHIDSQLGDPSFLDDISSAPTLLPKSGVYGSDILHVRFDPYLDQTYEHTPSSGFEKFIGHPMIATFHYLGSDHSEAHRFHKFSTLTYFAWGVVCYVCQFVLHDDCSSAHDKLLRSLVGYELLSEELMQNRIRKMGRSLNRVANSRNFQRPELEFNSIHFSKSESSWVFRRIRQHRNDPQPIPCSFQGSFLL